MDEVMTTNELAARAIRAESEAFVDLYRAAAEDWSTAHDDVEGVRAVWNPKDPDPAFSIILNLHEAGDYDAAIARFEQAGRKRGMPRLGINGNPEVERWKTASGPLASAFKTDSEEYFWARQLERSVEVPELSPGATVELAAARDRDLWGGTLNLGHDFDSGHARGHIYAAAIEQPGWLHYLIRVDGEPAAASVLYIAGDTGQLFVTATRPEFRSRGFQSYFIARRLHDARQHDCTLATTQTVTYNASPRNMERRGFQLLYKRQILTKSL